MSGGANPPSAALLAAIANAEPADLGAHNLSPPDRIKIWDALTRNGVAIAIVVMFFIANAFTLGVLIKLAYQDQHDLVRHIIFPGQRLVDKDVLMSLLGATTVQLGSIAVIMANYLFKAPTAS